MFYTLTIQCRFCRADCPWTVAAEVEPPPDAVIKVVCPNHGGPIPVPFRYFKPAEAPLPDAPLYHYPPRPPQPPVPYDPPSTHRWWQFWKW
jgi:hypothetical protein